jgi:hypothetical protein
MSQKLKPLDFIKTYVEGIDRHRSGKYKLKSCSAENRVGATDELTNTHTKTVNYRSVNDPSFKRYE